MKKKKRFLSKQIRKRKAIGRVFQMLFEFMQLLYSLSRKTYTTFSISEKNGVLWSSYNQISRKETVSGHDQKVGFNTRARDLITILRHLDENFPI